MKKAIKKILAVAALVLISGCATYAVRIADGNERVPFAADECYQAVSADVFLWSALCWSGDGYWFNADYSNPLQWLATPVVTLAVLPDFAVSAVFDTVLLPLDLWANRGGQ